MMKMVSALSSLAALTVLAAEPANSNLKPSEKQTPTSPLPELRLSTIRPNYDANKDGTVDNTEIAKAKIDFAQLDFKIDGVLNQADIAELRRNPDLALRIKQQSESQQIPPIRGILRTGIFALNNTNLPLAESTTSFSRDFAVAIGYQELVSQATYNLALIAIEGKDYPKALVCLDDSIAQAEKLPDSPEQKLELQSLKFQKLDVEGRIVEGEINKVLQTVGIGWKVSTGNGELSSPFYPLFKQLADITKQRIDILDKYFEGSLNGINSSSLRSSVRSFLTTYREAMSGEIPLDDPKAPGKILPSAVKSQREHLAEVDALISKFSAATVDDKLPVK